MPDARLLLAGLIAAGAGAALAQGKASPGGAAAAPAPAQTAPAADPTFEAARAAFEPLPEAERKAVQDALAWVAGYNSVVNGAFGRRTFEAVQAYQRRTNLSPNGVLDAGARGALLAAARRAREAVRFTVVTDGRSGAQIGVPAALLPRQEPNGGGTRWQSADGRITLDTRAPSPGDGDLPALYERLTGDVPGRKITYKVLRPDFLVVVGETATGRFYMRYGQAAGGALRGFSLGYDKALAQSFDPVVVAVANSFRPEPEAASAAPPAPPAPPPPRPDPAVATRPAAPLNAVTPPAASASGLVVASRRVLAVLPGACPAPTVSRMRARVVASEGPSGLVLLEVEGAGAATPPPARTGAAAADEGVIVLGFGGGPASGPVAVPGHLDGSGRLLAPLQPGAAGGAVLDRSGALVGLVGAVPAAPRQVAGIVPPLTYAMVPAARVGAFLEAQGLRLRAAEGQGSRSAGEIVGPLAGAVVAVACGR